MRKEVPHTSRRDTKPLEKADGDGANALGLLVFLNIVADRPTLTFGTGRSIYTKHCDAFLKNMSSQEQVGCGQLGVPFCRNSFGWLNAETQIIGTIPHVGTVHKKRNGAL